MFCGFIGFNADTCSISAYIYEMKFIRYNIIMSIILHRWSFSGSPESFLVNSLETIVINVVCACRINLTLVALHGIRV